MSSHFDTLAVHAGRQDLIRLGVHAPPIDLSTTYPVRDLDAGTAAFDALVNGAAEASNPIYARLHNPTVARCERALAELEGAEEAVLFASGMAALSACLLAARGQGDHVLAVRPLYGSSDHLLELGLLGLETRFVEAADMATAISKDTALVVLETPANPTLEMVDIRAVVAVAGKVPVLVDSTFATPVLQRPLELGATLVMHSATKFLGGHGDLIAGVIACNPQWGANLRKVRMVTGGLLHPLAAYLLQRGLPTLSLRVQRAQASAQVLAERLMQHARVSKVYYPGLGTVRNAHLVGTQMSGPGSLIAFDVVGGHDAAAMVMKSVQLALPAVSLGSVDTLIQHPAGLTHRVVDEKVKARYHIGPNLLRLSVGIEDVEDIWTDLSQALEATTKT